MLAALENRRAGDDCRLVAFYVLHETPAIGRHVMDDLGLVQPQPVEVDQVHVGAQSRRKPAAVGEPEEVGGF